MTFEPFKLGSLNLGRPRLIQTITIPDPRSGRPPVSRCETKFEFLFQNLHYLKQNMNYTFILFVEVVEISTNVVSNGHLGSVQLCFVMTWCAREEIWISLQRLHEAGVRGYGGGSFRRVSRRTMQGWLS